MPRHSVPEGTHVHQVRAPVSHRWFAATPAMLEVVKQGASTLSF